jgi:hypothetical protein
MMDRKKCGRPCTVVGGRPLLALMTPVSSIYFCGPIDPRDVRSSSFPVGGDIVNPRRLCSSCLLQDAPEHQAHTQLVFGAVAAQPPEIHSTRPTRNPPSHRRA